jgi:LPS sulfotransferase NodH
MATESSGLNPWESLQRTSRHARDPELEALLRKLNEHLAKARDLMDRPSSPRLPVLFVVGCARGGSTLLMQWLAATGLVAYPTNIMSRFYSDPYVGALIHRILHDLDHRGEVFPDRSMSDSFSSELGRTRGANAPHDFGYFWRRFFRFGETQDRLLAEPGPTEVAQLRSDVAAMEQVFAKPVLLKAMELNWQLPLLRSIFPDSVFLFIQRPVPENAISLLKARVSYFGTDTAWYSYKPAEYATVKDLPPWEQAVAQVWLTNRAVRTGLSSLPAADAIDVHYERFCEAPLELYAQLCQRLGLNKPYAGPASFSASAMPVDPHLSERARRIVDRLNAI